MQSGRRKGDILADRLVDFGVEVIGVVARLPKNLVGRTIARQLIRCGPSAGAHYGEARGAESRSDFVHKLGVALKEQRETVHWLNVIDRARMIPSRDLRPMINEGGELVAILMAANRTAKLNASKPRDPE